MWLQFAAAVDAHKSFSNVHSVAYHLRSHAILPASAAALVFVQFAAVWLTTEGGLIEPAR